MNAVGLNLYWCVTSSIENMSAVASGTQLSKGSEAINERTKSFFQAGTDAPKITTMIERAHHGKHEWSRFGERGGAPP